MITKAKYKYNYRMQWWYLIICRYVCWSAYLLKKNPKLESKLGSKFGLDNNDVSSSAAQDYTAKLPLDQKFYFQYYVQDDTDDGVLMNTKIKLKEVKYYSN